MIIDIATVIDKLQRFTIKTKQNMKIDISDIKPQMSNWNSDNITKRKMCSLEIVLCMKHYPST